MSWRAVAILSHMFKSQVIEMNIEERGKLFIYAWGASPTYKAPRPSVKSHQKEVDINLKETLKINLKETLKIFRTDSEGAASLFRRPIMRLSLAIAVSIPNANWELADPISRNDQ
jgi:hypothetical protein